MNYHEARARAREEMRKWGLTEDGWTFAWSQAADEFGRCEYSRKRIVLSETLTRLNAENEEEIVDTILHEIAHALAGHRAGHGWQWQEKARLVGARPQRTYDSKKVAVPAYKWTGTCPSCGKEIHRRTLFKEARTMSCGRCSGGTWNAAFVLEWKEN